MYKNCLPPESEDGKEKALRYHDRRRAERAKRALSTNKRSCQRSFLQNPHLVTTKRYLLELLSQLRHNLKQISHKPHIRDLENRRIRILINRRNDLTILHTRQMLNSS
jgi:hypothetical protein